MFRTLLTCSLSKKNSFSTSVLDVVNLFGPRRCFALRRRFHGSKMRVAGICCRLNARPKKADNQWNQRTLVTTRNPPPCESLWLCQHQRRHWFCQVFQPHVAHRWFGWSSSPWLSCLGFWYQKDIHVFLFQVWKIPVWRSRLFYHKLGKMFVSSTNLRFIENCSGVRFFLEFSSLGGIRNRNTIN